MHCDEHHNVYSHYGIRTHRYKLIYYYGEAFDLPGSKDIPQTPEWELFDLEKDPYELDNVFDQPDYREIVQILKTELERLQDELGDVAVHK